MKRRKTKRNRKSGSMLAEAAITVMLMVPCIGVGLNAAFGLIGYELLDGGSRDAARAAAQALSDPTNPETPHVRAQKAADAAIASHCVGPFNMTAQVVAYNFVVRDVLGESGGTDTNNFYLCDPVTGSVLPNHAGPSVTVQAVMTYNLPFPVPAIGGDPSAGNAPITFRQTYTFPILTPTLYVPEE